MVRCIYCLVTNHDTPKRSFHSIPDINSAVYDKWLLFLNNKFPDAVFSKSSKLCSDHFIKDDFVHGQKIMRLKIEAVPKTQQQITAHPIQLKDISPSLEDFPSFGVEDTPRSTRESVSPFRIQRPPVHTESNVKGTNTTGFYLKPNIFNSEYILARPRELGYYTGFKHKQVFLSLLKFFIQGKKKLPIIKPVSQERKPNPDTPRLKRGSRNTLSDSDQFLMTMMRLRHNFGVEHLGHLFQVHKSTVSRTFNSWVIVMSKMLAQTPIWPSKELVKNILPAKFLKFPNTRVILDCTEIQIQKASGSLLQAETYSYYKSRNTAKGLVGITPLGQVSFVSNLYGGKNSDKKIVQHSGVLDLLEPGDAVMVDRGFRIEAECKHRDLQLIIPDFTVGAQQFSDASVKNTRSIAMARGLVETIIGKTKHFKILSNAIPLSLAPVLNHIWLVCNYLTNFTSSLDALAGEDAHKTSKLEIPNIPSYPAGQKMFKKVKVPKLLIQTFLDLAKSNTDSNIETIAWLFAIEDSSKYSIKYLVLPKQQGNSWSVTTFAEEEVLARIPENHVQIGWIHTHPSQTCFMSSQDLHTHFALQSDCKNSIAIVCAPAFNRYDVFRLEVPYGMDVIRECKIPVGLHAHENILGPLYAVAENIEVDASLLVNVIDLRQI